MVAYHIHIEGQVQGVGFRPFVFRMAQQNNLTGWVSNGVDGVHIEIYGEENQARKFYHTVIRNAPAAARITHYSIYEIEPQLWIDFSIRESSHEGTTQVLVTPDIPICDSCKMEILDSSNHRFHYAFTTCTNCGPRYSIIKEIPYDRAGTAMQYFAVCPHCQQEYADPQNRRHYSQTNSCPHCAITLSLHEANGTLITESTDEIIRLAVQFLKEGKIIAMKGIGGYLLLCDAEKPEPIDKLRERKHRPAKPFALLYPSMDFVMRDNEVGPHEAKALQSNESPIVLLKARTDAKVAQQQIAPGLKSLGVMLPYTPLMLMLMQAYGNPVVATSANESGSPIYYNDEEALQHLNQVADYFIINNREIVVPQDDSVVRFTQNGQRIVMRRSRSMAPTYVPHPLTLEEQSWLAMGSDMKSAFALLHQGNAYVSQYLGDLENYQTQESYLHTLNHWKKLLSVNPQRILIDKHPAYHSSMLGKRMATDNRASLVEVQHHQAHFAAVLAENNLLESAEPVLGVIWDGTGWGDDGNIWGGEFFLYQNGAMDRVGHLDYYNHFLGDKVSREPRLCALSLCHHLSSAEDLLKSKFTNTEWSLYNKILNQPDLLQTSSIGRLFDGVASLLGLCDKTTYEGEAAAYLEELALQAVTENDLPRARWNLGKDFTLRTAMTQLIEDIKYGVPKAEIAFQFHMSLVRWIAKMATRQEVTRIAFSGGVFQNSLLVQLIKKQLGDHYQLYFHQQLSPNDECIGFGQLARYYIQKHIKTKAIQQKAESKVTI